MRTKKLLQKRLGLVVQRRSAACHAETLCTSVTGSHALTACRGAIMMHGTLPSPSNHVSRPSSETRKAMIMAMVVEDPQTHGQLKTNALVRDGFRCVVTGEYNYTSVVHNKELQLEMKGVAGAAVCNTECAHIFPELTNKLHYASSVWAVLERFGYENAFEELNGSGIHRLENILTLKHDVQTFFHRLLLWLEPVFPVIPNTYKLCSASPFVINDGWKTTVTFTSPDPVKLPVPSAAYLELHAACCRVANNLSDHIDNISRDMEDMQVLSQDCASAEALQYALWPLSQNVAVY